MDIDKIKQKVLGNKFRLSQHAENEKQQDKIYFKEINEVSKNLELIEYYPDDPRGHSCLLLGFTLEGKPLHFVCGDLEKEKILFITIYRPQSAEWINYRIRRKK